MRYSYITTRDQLRLVLPTTADVNDAILAEMQSYFARAENQLLRPWLGQPTLDQIHAPAAEHADVVAQLVELLAPAIASYGYSIYAQEGNQLLTSQGPRRNSALDQKPLTPAELAAQVAALREGAHAQLDQALVFLESHPETFTAWHGSRWSTIRPLSFFRTADELSRYLRADLSRAGFRDLWPAINAAELGPVRWTLGRALMNRLLVVVDQPEHAELIGLVRTGIVGQVLGVRDEVAHAAGCTAMEELVHLLNLPESLASYPEYESSATYRPPYRLTDQSNAFYSGY